MCCYPLSITYSAGSASEEVKIRIQVNDVIILCARGPKFDAFINHETVVAGPSPAASAGSAANGRMNSQYSP